MAIRATRQTGVERKMQQFQPGTIFHLIYGSHPKVHMLMRVLRDVSLRAKLTPSGW